MDKGMKYWFVIIFFLVLIFLRCFDVTSDWMGLITVVSLLITIVNLYLECAKSYGIYQEFLKIRGLAIVIGTIAIIVVALILTNKIVLSSKQMDVCSLLALLISVPTPFYCNLLENFLWSEK